MLLACLYLGTVAPFHLCSCEDERYFLYTVDAHIAIAQWNRSTRLNISYCLRGIASNMLHGSLQQPVEACHGSPAWWQRIGRLDEGFICSVVILVSARLPGCFAEPAVPCSLCSCTLPPEIQNLAPRARMHAQPNRPGRPKIMVQHVPPEHLDATSTT